MDFLSSVPHGKRELRIDLAEPRLLGNFDSEAICLWCCKMLRSTSQNGSIMLSHCWLLKIYILELCVSSVSELYQWYSTWNPRSQVIQKMSPMKPLDSWWSFKVCKVLGNQEAVRRYCQCLQSTSAWRVAFRHGTGQNTPSHWVICVWGNGWHSYHPICGFPLSWGYPNSWVDFMENPSINGWWLGVPLF